MHASHERLPRVAVVFGKYFQPRQRGPGRDQIGKLEQTPRSAIGNAQPGAPDTELAFASWRTLRAPTARRTPRSRSVPHPYRGGQRGHPTSLPPPRLSRPAERGSVSLARSSSEVSVSRSGTTSVRCSLSMEMPSSMSAEQRIRSAGSNLMQAVSRPDQQVIARSADHDRHRDRWVAGPGQTDRATGWPSRGRAQALTQVEQRHAHAGTRVSSAQPGPQRCRQAEQLSWWLGCATRDAERVGGVQSGGQQQSIGVLGQRRRQLVATGSPRTLRAEVTQAAAHHDGGRPRRARCLHSARHR